MYTAEDLEKAVRTASVDFAGLKLISTGIQGKLNIAAFIAQAQKESIAYDVCDGEFVFDSKRIEFLC